MLLFFSFLPPHLGSLDSDSNGVSVRNQGRYLGEHLKLDTNTG